MDVLLAQPPTAARLPAPACATPERRALYRRFGDLLDYPGPHTAELARATVSLLANTQAPVQMANFAVYIGVAGLERLEEIYTATFEINPASFIYAGYVLFGESAKRGALIVKLQEEYRRRSFAFSGELADHLSLMFRYLALVDDDPELVHDLLAECIAPALHQMHDALDAANPYAGLLRAILAVIDPDGQATLAQVLARFGGGFLPSSPGM
jgi:nitrate reductase delta subunit